MYTAKLQPNSNESLLEAASTVPVPMGRRHGSARVPSGKGAIEEIFARLYTEKNAKRTQAWYKAVIT